MNNSEVLENLRNGMFNDFLDRLEQIYDYIAFTCDKKDNDAKLMQNLNNLIDSMNATCEMFNEELERKLKPFNKRFLDIDL